MADSRSPRRGVWLVVGLLGFGMLLTGVLYVYAVMHRGPFQDLTAALEAEFPELALRVEGGKPRLNEPGPRILRVRIQGPSVGRDPETAEQRAARIARFVHARAEAERYDVLEVHVHRRARGNTRFERSFRYPLAQSQSVTQNGDTSN